MSEFMGLIHGTYDAKASGYLPGGASLHNCMSAHGPDQATYERAIETDLGPCRLDDTMAFMFETRAIIGLTRHAAESPLCQRDYDNCWKGFHKAQLPPGAAQQ
jgi:homogentisate 1,2-dioxygenase